MRSQFVIFICISFSNLLSGQNTIKQEFISKDISHFWDAYDHIITTNDTLLQQKFLKELYLDKATEGLKSLIAVRNYTAKELLENIKKSPKFWKSIRENTLETSALYPEIESDVRKLKTHYPQLKPMPIYFAIGAFRTNGTIHDNKILIGSEYSLVDEKTVVLEDLPKARHWFYPTFKPRKNIGLLATHEYIHTQQKRMADNLLSYCLYEGIAEFVSCKVTGKASTTPAIAFGKAHQEEVVEQFVKDLVSESNTYNWLWGENRNHLKERDLGYYIGYEIAERYYTLSTDKKEAIKNLIELDSYDEKAVEQMVDATHLLPKPLQELRADYDRQRPTIASVSPFNEKIKVKPGIVQFSITFSEEMDPNYRGFDYGPMGEKHSYRFKKVIGWSNDNKTFTIEIEVDPSHKYQVVLSNAFRNKQGFRLKPYLIEFETGQ